MRCTSSARVRGVVAQVVRRHDAEAVDQRARELEPLGDVVAVLREKPWQHVVPVDLDVADPGEVVEPRVVEVDRLRSDAQPPGEQALEADRDVAQTHRSVALLEQGAGHDADRVGEVDDPRVLCRMLAHGVGDVEHDRHGAQRLREAAGAGGLLTHAVARQRERLVARASGLTAYP